LSLTLPEDPPRIPRDEPSMTASFHSQALPPCPNVPEELALP